MNMTVLRESAYRTADAMPHTGITRLILTAPMIEAIREYGTDYWTKHTSYQPEEILREHLRDVLSSMPADDILDLDYARRNMGPHQMASMFMDKMTSMGELKKQIDAACDKTLEYLRPYYES